MSINHILESAGTSVETLDNAVSTYQKLIDRGLGQVSLESFDIESHATTIELLATRLDAIYSMIEPLLVEDGPASLLAKAIVAEIAPDPLLATSLVRIHLGSGLVDDMPGVLLSERPLYGHPSLRHVIQGVFDHDSQSLVVTAFIVDLRSGEVSSVMSDERPAQAAVRVSKLGATAVTEVVA